jgi:hypothetical protein
LRACSGALAPTAHPAEMKAFMNGSRADGSTNNAKASTGKAGKPESKGLIGQLSRLGSKMSMTPRPPIDPKAPVYDGPLVDGKAFGKVGGQPKSSAQ